MSPVPSPRPAAGPLRLRLLERPALCLADGREHLLAPKDAALLLLLARRGPMDRDALAGLLWPDSTPAAAQNSLRQRDFRLAKAAGGPLLSKQGALSLAPGVAHDLDDPAARLAADAWSLRTPLLAGMAFPDEPELARALEAERRRWDGELREALMRLISARNAAHQIAGAIACAQRLVADEPTSEHAARLLMRLHHRRGDRALALEAFDALKRHLHDTLGEAPSQETVELVRQIGSAQVHDSPPVAALPLALQRPPQLGGRDAVVAAALQRLRLGGPVLLSGPAGIGKTSVFDELLRALQPAVVARLQPEDRGIAHAAARRLAQAWPAGAEGADADLLRWLRLPPGAAAPGVVSAARVHDAFCGALAVLPAGTAAAVVAVDDLHFADDEGAALFGRLLREGPRRPWLLAARGHELAEPLSQWLLAQPDGDEAQFELGPLSAADLRPLLAAALGAGADLDAWADALASHCSGHPLSALQVLRALHAQGALAQALPPAELPVPREASQRVARQLERCDERTQHLAYAAALCGGEFGVDVARRVLGCSATELVVPWRRLQGLGLARDAAYTHELVRQAVAEMVPAVLAPAIHGEIAAALRDAGVDPARRVRHWAAAARWAEAGRDQVAAAGIALAAGARLEARSRLLDAAPELDRAGLADEAFDALARAMPLSLAQLSADEAQRQVDALLARASTPTQHCRAALARAQLACERHDDDALPLSLQAQQLALALGDAALQRRARFGLAVARRVVGDHAPSLALVEALIAEGDGADADENEQLAELHALLLAELGRRHASAAIFVDAWRRAQRGHDLARTAEHAGNAAIQLGYLCRLDEALDLAEAAMALDRRLGNELSFSAVNEASVAALHADLGHYDRALEIGQRCVDALRRSGLPHFLVSAENTLSAAYLQLGRADLAHPLLADAPATAPPWARALRRAAQCGLAHFRGESPWPAAHEARLMLEASLGAGFSGYLRQRIELEEARWSAPAEAAACARRCAAWAQDHEHTALERLARFVEIEGLLRAGHAAEAAQRADALVAHCAGDWSVYGVYRPNLWLVVVGAWDAVGRHAEADTLAVHAAAWIGERAACDVPPVFREPFLQRNRTNASLLARAQAVRGPQAGGAAAR